MNWRLCPPQGVKLKQTLFSSAQQNTGIDQLSDALAHSTSILVGQSGVGKSSLIKCLLPELDITIGRLSAASGQGRHTTTTTTLYHLPRGGDLIDSPGVRDFRLEPTGADKLARGFREFRPWLGQCRFHNCRQSGLARRPVHRAAAHKVQMDVVDGLARLRIAVHDHAVATLGNPVGGGHLLGGQVQLTDDIHITFIQIISGRNMLPGYHQDVGR